MRLLIALVTILQPLPLFSQTPQQIFSREVVIRQLLTTTHEKAETIYHEAIDALPHDGMDGFLVGVGKFGIEFCGLTGLEILSIVNDGVEITASKAPVYAKASAQIFLQEYGIALTPSENPRSQCMRIFKANTNQTGNVLDGATATAHEIWITPYKPSVLKRDVLNIVHAQNSVVRGERTTMLASKIVAILPLFKLIPMAGRFVGTTMEETYLLARPLGNPFTPVPCYAGVASSATGCSIAATAQTSSTGFSSAGLSALLSASWQMSPGLWGTGGGSAGLKQWPKKVLEAPEGSWVKIELVPDSRNMVEFVYAKTTELTKVANGFDIKAGRYCDGGKTFLAPEKVKNITLLDASPASFPEEVILAMEKDALGLSKEIGMLKWITEAAPKPRSNLIQQIKLYKGMDDLTLLNRLRAEFGTEIDILARTFPPNKSLVESLREMADPIGPFAKGLDSKLATLQEHSTLLSRNAQEALASASELLPSLHKLLE